jgi:hypothetical protein
MKCESCSDKAEVVISWVATKSHQANVCGCCASFIWSKLSNEFSGTPAFTTFTCIPIGDL